MRTPRKEQNGQWNGTTPTLCVPIWMHQFSVIPVYGRYRLVSAIPNVLRGNFWDFSSQSRWFERSTPRWRKLSEEPRLCVCGCREFYDRTAYPAIAINGINSLCDTALRSFPRDRSRAPTKRRDATWYRDRGDSIVVNLVRLNYGRLVITYWLLSSTW